MKKLLFTALIAVAFNAVATAKTVEAKKTSLKTKVVQKDAKDCAQNAINVYEYVIGGGADDLDLLNALMSLCS